MFNLKLFSCNHDKIEELINIIKYKMAKGETNHKKEKKKPKKK
jgi:hypothetical protein